MEDGKIIKLLHTEENGRDGADTASFMFPVKQTLLEG
jgi:hypothetical protein